MQTALATLASCENVTANAVAEEVDVKVETTESDERIKELQAQVEARFPVYTLFNAADVKMNDNWVNA